MAGVQPNKEYVLKYENFRGGLNLRDAEEDLAQNESPEMKNLLWRNGVLSSRRGLTYLNAAATRGTGLACFGGLWHGHFFFHAGTKIFACSTEDGTVTVAASGVPGYRGSFFLFGGDLFYKNRGAYIRITAAQSGGEWSFSGAAVDPYVPVILINTAPSTAAGDIYQPENRLSAKKTVWYNAAAGVTQYLLPVKATAVNEVWVDGVQLLTGWSYSSSTGIVTFSSAPPVHDPPVNNTVRITYTLVNQAAYDSVSSCCYAEVYGGTGELCVVLGGSGTQPNAYFWSGNSSIAMEPGYFPMEQVQLAGDVTDPVTGFGKQQNALVIFSEHQIGKTVLGTEEIPTGGGGSEETVTRLAIDLPYIPVNTKIGCRYPWSIQLIRNNLVWATSSGVYVLLDTTEANENYVRCISDKIAGAAEPGASAHRGLLYDLKQAGAGRVSSVDDEHRYSVIANGNVYCWDYDLTTYREPAWFLLTGYGTVIAAAYENEEQYYLDSVGRAIRQTDAYTDFGRAFERIYRIPVTTFGELDRRKTVKSVIWQLGAETVSRTALSYITEYETRADPVPLEIVPAADYEEEREPGTRPQSARVTAVFRRRPMCRRILHFAMKLRNANAGEDLAIMKAEIYYEKLGRLR